MKGNVFGDILKGLRLDAKMSQKELGQALGFCNQSVSFWEKGEREPDLDTLISIADYFNVSIGYLFGRED